MKISDINLETVQQYLRLNPGEDEAELKIYIDAAKNYIMQYTGLTSEEIEDKEYFTIPALMLISEFYENKSIQGTKKINIIYENLLNLGIAHSIC